MKKNFKSINTTLNTLLSNYNLSHIYSLEVIKKEWINYDKTIAANSEPIEYNGKTKTLKIKVKSKTWKTEFINNHKVLTLNINNYFSDISIKKIEII